MKKMGLNLIQKQVICAGLVTKCLLVRECQKTAETCDPSLSDKKRWSWGKRGTLTIFQSIDQSMFCWLFFYSRCYNKCFPPTLFPPSPTLISLHHCPFDLSHPFRGRWADPPAGGSEPSWGCWSLNCHCCGVSDHLECGIEKNRGRKR